MQCDFYGVRDERRGKKFSSFPFRFLMRYVGDRPFVWVFLVWFYLCIYFHFDSVQISFQRDKMEWDLLPILPALISNKTQLCCLLLWGAVKKSHFQNYSFVSSFFFPFFNLLLVSLWKFNKNSFYSLWSGASRCVRDQEKKFHELFKLLFDLNCESENYKWFYYVCKSNSIKIYENDFHQNENKNYMKLMKLEMK